MNTAAPRHARLDFALDHRQRFFVARERLPVLLDQERTPACSTPASPPCTPTPISTGTQPPSTILNTFAAKNGRSNDRNSTSSGSARAIDQCHVLAHHDVVDDRGDGHRAGDRDAVRRRPGRSDRRKPSTSSMHPTASSQLICGHVDLPFRLRRGVLDRDAREKAELHGLARERKRARDQRLRRDHRGRAGEPDQRPCRRACRARGAKNGFSPRVRARAAPARLGRSSRAAVPASRSTSHTRRIGRAPKWPMSAYSASPPVTASTTEPEHQKAVPAVRREEAHGVAAATARAKRSASCAT